MKLDNIQKAAGLYNQYVHLLNQLKGFYDNSRSLEIILGGHRFDPTPEIRKLIGDELRLEIANVENELVDLGVELKKET